MSDALHARFLSFVSRLAPQAPAESLWLLIEALYHHPPRAYHTLDHIAACLATFDSVRHHAARLDDIELALYLHDAIYFPTRSDNEQRSADLTSVFAPALHLDPAPVQGLILATRHTGEPLRGDQALIADIDLAILAAPPADYDRYAAAIRAEYAQIPAPDYNRGRAAFLTRLLDHPCLYQTCAFAPLETHARANLRREITDLSHRGNGASMP